MTAAADGVPAPVTLQFTYIPILVFLPFKQPIESQSHVAWLRNHATLHPTTKSRHALIVGVNSKFLSDTRKRRASAMLRVVNLCMLRVDMFRGMSSKVSSGTRKMACCPVKNPDAQLAETIPQRVGIPHAANWKLGPRTRRMSEQRKLIYKGCGRPVVWGTLRAGLASAWSMPRWYI